MMDPKKLIRTNQKIVNSWPTACGHTMTILPDGTCAVCDDQRGKMTMGDVAELRRAVLAERCKRSLSRFVRLGWASLHPDKPIDWGWHLQAICDHVQALLADLYFARMRPAHVMECHDLIINVPPRSLKTEIVQVFAPAWLWTIDPSVKIRCISGNARVVKSASIACRDLIRSSWYQRTFAPSWRLREDVDAIGLFSNDRMGERHAGTIGSKITGEGTDVLICDDPNDAGDIHSEVIRTGVNDAWKNAIHNRVNDPRRCARIGIMQRLHEEDWTGACCREWQHLSIPHEYEGPQPATWIGWSDPRTTVGELMHPDRFDRPWVEREKARLMAYGWAGQHQQRPAPAAGGIFRRDWLRYLERAAMPKRFEDVVISVDCAAKQTEDGSRTAIMAIGRHGPNRYVLECWVGHPTMADTADRIVAMMAAHKARKVLIEDKAAGPAVIEMLRSKIQGVIAVNPEGGKVARAYAVQPIVEGGNLIILEGAAWVGDLVEELAVFPRGSRDDQVDALTQALNYTRTSSNAMLAMTLGGR